MDNAPKRAGRGLLIDFEDGVTLSQLIERVQEARGKPLDIRELAELSGDSGSLCGLWLATETKDIVLHAPSDSPLHRQQFLLHELAHMILRHDHAGSYFAPHNLLPDLDPQTVKTALAREHLDDDFELDAEALADELAAAIRHGRGSRFTEVFG